MIKWKGTRDGQPIVGFGLEERNLERLRAGDPIHVFGEQMGLPFDVLIYYGKDHAALMELSKGGIGPDTIIHDERGKPKQ